MQVAQGNPVRLMFVCTKNSARSQMAEGFALSLGQGRIEARSVGLEPGQLNPFGVAVMREKGIDISRQQPKAFEEDLARQMDIVVTACGNAEERCPVLPAGGQTTPLAPGGSSLHDRNGHRDPRRPPTDPR